MAEWHVDLVNGSDGNSGLSFASPLLTPQTGLVGKVGPGDTVKFAKSPDPIDTGVAASWADGFNLVGLASPLTVGVESCEEAWAPRANVACTVSVVRREGNGSAQIAPAGAFVTGVMAVKSFAVPVDLSAYTRLSWAMRVQTADLLPNTIRLDLCSDEAGDTPIISYTIPYRIYANNNPYWYPVVFDNGGPLPDNVRSIALTALADPGTPLIFLDNILACNELTLASLVQKGDDTDPHWWPIQSIQGSTLWLGSSYVGVPSTGYRWFGPSGTANLRVRTPLRLAASPAAAVLLISAAAVDGNFGSPICYSGGWNPASGEQDGETFVDYYNCYGPGWGFNSRWWTVLERFGIVRTSHGIHGSGGGHLVRDCWISDCFTNGLTDNWVESIIERVMVNTVASWISGSNNTWYGRNKLIDCKFYGYALNGITILDGWIEAIRSEFMGAVGYGVRMGGYGLFSRCIFAGNGSADIQFNDNRLTWITLVNCITEHPIKWGVGGATWSAINQWSYVRIHNLDGTGQHKQFLRGGDWVISDPTVRNTPSGLAWRVNPVAMWGGGMPLRWPLPPLEARVEGGKTYRVGGHLRKNAYWHGTQQPRLLLLGGRVGGVPNDVAMEMVGPPDAYELVEALIEPTEDGVIQITGEFCGATGAAWVDDLFCQEVVEP